MGTAAFEDDRPFLTQPLAAAPALCRTEQGNLHAGVLYKDYGQAAVLHLGWEDRLSRNWHWQRLWAAPDQVPERLLSAAGLCKLVWKDFEQWGLSRMRCGTWEPRSMRSPGR